MLTSRNEYHSRTAAFAGLLSTTHRKLNRAAWSPAQATRVFLAAQMAPCCFMMEARLAK